MLAWRKTVCSLAMVFFAACSNSSMPNDGGNDDGSTMGDTHADTHTDVRHAGCRGATSCASCSAMNTNSIACGWSIRNNACLDADPMNALQSADGSSTGSDWAPLAGLCPGSTLCQSRTDCVSCDTQGGGCGWCAVGNHCLPGLGPSSQDGSCTGANWITYGGYCPNAAEYCAANSGSCMSCTDTPICGVCSGTTNCLPGTATGPLMGTTQLMCTTGPWAWIDMRDCPTYDAGMPGDASPTDTGPPADTGPVDSGSPPDAGLADTAPSDGTSG